MSSEDNFARGWPAAEVMSLLRLLDRLRQRPEITNHLLTHVPGYLEDHYRSEDVSAEWDDLRHHTLWPKMENDRALQRLRDAFDTNRNRARRVAYPRDHFALLYWAIWGATLYAQDYLQPRGPHAVSAELRDRAVQTIKRMRGYGRRGVRMQDPEEDDALWILLGRLEKQLSSRVRKVHQHPAFRESECVRWFTQQMIQEFDGTSETVVKRFAEFAGVVLEDNSIGRIVKKVRQGN